MGRGAGAKRKQPKKKAVEMPFEWSDAAINDVMEQAQSSATLAKYASSPDKESPGQRRWAPPVNVSRKVRKPQTLAEKLLAAERATCPVAEPATTEALQRRLEAWFATPVGAKVAASSPKLPLGPFVDDVLDEPVRKRFSRFEGINEEAVALTSDEVSCTTWAPCTVIGGYAPTARTYQVVFEDRTEERHACCVAFPSWSDAGEIVTAFTAALRRRRDAEALLAFAHTIKSIPVNEAAVTLPLRESWARLLRIGLSRGPFDSDAVREEALREVERTHELGRPCYPGLPPPPPSATELTGADVKRAQDAAQLCGEVAHTYHEVMNSVVFASDALNPYHLKAWLARDLPAPPPLLAAPVCGVAANPREFVQPQKTVFRAKTFLECPEVVHVLATALSSAQDVKATRLLTTTHAFPRTPSHFEKDQDEHIKATVRKLREGWVMRTSSAINNALKTADQTVYDLNETSIRKHESASNKLHLLLTRINYSMVQDLLDLTRTSLEEYAQYVLTVCEGSLDVRSIADVRCEYPPRNKGDPPRLQRLFRMTVVSTDEPRVLNKTAVDDANRRIEAWRVTADEGEECPIAAVEPVEGRTFDYETPLLESVDCVLNAFTKAIAECRNIRCSQNYVMERLFWTTPALIKAVRGEQVTDLNGTQKWPVGEEWIGALVETLTTAITAALKPCEAYLNCFRQWEAFLNLDVEAYVANLTHAVPNDEEYEEGQEPDAPSISVELPKLRQTLTEHVEAKKSIEEAIPAEALSAGACELNAFALREELGSKHMAIINLILGTHSQHILEFSDFLDGRYKAMMRELEKDPSDIEKTAELEDYIKNMGTDLRANQELIDEMRSMNAVLDDYFYRVEYSHFERQTSVALWPVKIQDQARIAEGVIAANRAKLLQDQIGEQAAFADALNDLQTFAFSFDQYTSLTQCTEAAANARDCMAQVEAAGEQSRLFNAREILFEREVTDYTQLAAIKKKFEPYYQLWDTSENWLTASKTWHTHSFVTLDAEVIEVDVTQYGNAIQKASKFFERNKLEAQSAIAKEIRAQVKAFTPYVPIIVALRNQGMRTRHWVQVGSALGLENFEPDANFTLDALLALNPASQEELITKVSEAAAKEFNIEQTLDKMLGEWTGMELQIFPYKDTGTSILTGIDEIQAILDEHVTMTQAMQFSAFKGPFEERISSWNHKLFIIGEVLDAWLDVQRNWMYLQPIFESPDINKQLPAEGKKFATVNKNWTSTMSSAKARPVVMEFCDDEKLLKKLSDSAKILDQVQKGLNDYLETKRGIFARFYFLSNDDLLSILSESKDVTKVQPHFKKCFEAIDAVKFEPLEASYEITQMISPEKEVVPMMTNVDPSDKSVEVWMVEFEEMMRLSIRHVMHLAIQDYVKTERTLWMQKWPSMCVLNGSQMYWTLETETLLNEKGVDGPPEMLSHQIEQLKAMVILVRGDIPNAMRNQVGALAVIDVHARDVMIRMQKERVSDISDFTWASQLRYYWRDDDLYAHMVAANRKYGYEYLGNSFRLVITPLTDKCYLTLMGALQMILGGAPAGPAGTGKTETTKDLAKAVAMQCVVFNCSDGLDYQAMGKFFKGLASCGAWACFDEFNRINIEVLSVVGQQVMSIQLAIKAKVEKIEFEGSTIKVLPGFGVFITMNPGYAGRSALPDSLSALFRPVAMMVPDYALIGEIMFFAYGFENGKECGQKMVTTFRLCSEQCSSQPHYDYGMRAVKTVITAAGNLKRKEPEADELILLLRALQDVNIPKFLAGDLPLFGGIISDLFPGKQRPELDYGALISVMEETIDKHGLQPHPWFMGKVVELYEMIVVRHGLMLVGPTGGGKSRNFHVLEDTLGELKTRGEQGFAYEKIKIYQLNPKSITMGQMYGEFDPNTREWQDGIMSTMYRHAAASTSSDRKWIMFDGPVDAIWIENMNTVLDDNKKLCLVSGESIKMSNEMTMMFEVEDLLVASPATVSRVGIIYMEPKALGLDVLRESWVSRTLKHCPCFEGTQFKAIMAVCFDQYLFTAIGFMRAQMSELLPTMDNNLCESLTRLMDCFLEPFCEKEGRDAPKKEVVARAVAQLEARFIFSLVWSVGGTGPAPSRARFDMWLRAQLRTNAMKNAFPDSGLVYDYVWDEETGWKGWMDTIDEYKVDSKLSFAELIVPTPDSVRSTYILAKLLANRYHCMMVGETGTGKTVTISQYLQGVSKCEGKSAPSELMPLTMTFSAQTSANMTQDTLDGKFEKRRRGIFGPPAGKFQAIHVDDLNMPKRETYGAQPPIEILRQWFSQGGWFDRSNDLAYRKIIDIVFIASLGPPGGGRQDMTARFVRPFNVVGLAEMSDASKAGIFETILGTFLSGFTPAIAKLTEGLVASTIDTFNTVVASLLPTPAKSHYTFNLRDLAKVFQGTLMGSPKMILEPVGMVRLWVHELKRVFEDRLTTTQDHDWFRSQLETCCAQKFSMKWSEIQRTERLMYCDFTDPTADPRIYSEVEDIDKLKLVVNDFLEEHNAESKSPMPLVMFLDAIEHVLRIARILRQPQGNALLLGVGGSGRQSMSKMATYISGYELFQVEIAKGYGMPEWREDLRKCLLGAGVKDQQTAFIFTDAQVVMEAMLEDVNNILNAGDVPNLYGPEELDAIMSACRVDCQKKQITPTKTNIFAQYIVRVRRNMHVCLCMSPLGETFRERLRQFPSLVNCSTIDWFTEWPAEALESVGLSALVEANQVKPENRQGVVKMFKQIHQDVRRGVRRSGFNLRDASLPRIDGFRDSLFINTGRGEIQGVLRGAAKVQLCDTYVLLGIIIFVRFSPRVQTRRSRDQKEPVEDRSGQDHQYRRTGRRHAKRVRDLSPPTHRKRQGSGRDDGRH